MYILALETSTDSGSLALWADGRIDLRPCPAQESQSQTLIPLIKAMLADAALELRALNGIVFDHGPGAFTGLRVACSVAQGFACAAGIPLFGIGSLEILAAQAAQTGFTNVLALLDARMNEVYAGVYRQGVLQQPVGVYCPERLPALEPGPDWALCGNALNVYPQLTSQLAGSIQHWLPHQVPRADTLAQLAVPHFTAGESIDPAEAIPCYVRNKVALTEAERRIQKGNA